MMKTPSAELNVAPSRAAAAAPDSFEELRLRLEARYDGLSPHLQRLARLALDEPNLFAFGTVASVAEKASVQPSSVVRFARAVGYGGFPGMQNVFRSRLILPAPVRRPRDPARGDMDAETILRSVVAQQVAALLRVETQPPTSGLEAAAALLREASGVVLIGYSRALPVAAHLFQALVQARRRCHLLDGLGGLMRQQIGALNGDDLLIGIAIGEPAPVLTDAIRHARLRGVPAIVLTDDASGPLAGEATVVLSTEGGGAGPLSAVCDLLCLSEALLTLGSAAAPS